ncbi:MAG: TRAP transporter small permease [Bacillota bacterium]|nr:TRAP transporter small permease [Bacillota bacterium]
MYSRQGQGIAAEGMHGPLRTAAVQASPLPRWGNLRERQDHPLGKEVRSKKMKNFSGFMEGMSEKLDRFAGCVLLGVMTLVVANVLLRAIWSAPIKGTYEYVGFFTALAIGLSIAYCGAKNGHIAVTFIVDKFSPAIRKVLGLLVHCICVAFMSFLAWKLYVYGAGLASRGDVSLTTRIPYYPLIYLIGFCFLVLAFVHVGKIIGLLEKGEKK